MPIKTKFSSIKHLGWFWLNPYLSLLQTLLKSRLITRVFQLDLWHYTVRYQVFQMKGLSFSAVPELTELMSIPIDGWLWLPGGDCGMEEGTVTESGGSCVPRCKPEVCIKGVFWGRVLATWVCCCCWEVGWLKNGYGGSCCSRDNASIATALKRRIKSNPCWQVISLHFQAHQVSHQENCIKSILSCI